MNILAYVQSIEKCKVFNIIDKHEGCWWHQGLDDPKIMLNQSTDDSIHGSTQVNKEYGNIKIKFATSKKNYD